jgi:hypothetical protein
MPHRLLSLSSAAGLTLAGTVAAVASPATAAPVPAPVTATVAVPVSCVFTPASTAAPAFDATVSLTAPATVRSWSQYRIGVQVSTPIGRPAPISLLGLGFTSTLTASGARPAGPLTFTQAPVDVPEGGSVVPETFSRRLLAGWPGSTIRYTFDRYTYTFAIATGDPNLRPVATCTPTTGGPVTLGSTRVIGRGRG